MTTHRAPAITSAAPPASGSGHRQGTVRDERIGGIVSEQYFAKPMHAVFRADELAAYTAASLDLAHPMLDLGCGKGEFGAAFARLMGIRLIDFGMDLTPNYVRRANGTGLYGSVIRGDATRLPFGDESMGFVVSNGVLCCIPRSDRSPVDEIARVLRPGAQAVVTVPTPQFADLLAPSRWFRRVGLSSMGAWYGERSNLRHGHRRLESLEAWRHEFESAGLLIEDVVFFFTGEVATWWSILAMRPFQLLSALRFAPRGAQRGAAAVTRRCIDRMHSDVSRTGQGRGYMLLLARKPVCPRAPR